jgi:phenylalanyl-tRNA synthetase beta chain
VDFYDVKRDVDAILGSAGAGVEYIPAEHPALHPGQTARLHAHGAALGWLGRIHPALARSCDIDPNTCLFELAYEAVRTGRLPRFREISRFPSIRRDLAVVVDEAVPAADVEAVVRQAAGEQLQELVIFDVYQGKGIETGRKSIAFGLILQDSSRTLTDQEVEAVVGRVTTRLDEKVGATLRD